MEVQRGSTPPKRRNQRALLVNTPLNYPAREVRSEGFRKATNNPESYRNLACHPTTKAVCCGVKEPCSSWVIFMEHPMMPKGERREEASRETEAIDGRERTPPQPTRGAAACPRDGTNPSRRVGGVSTWEVIVIAATLEEVTEARRKVESDPRRGFVFRAGEDWRTLFRIVGAVSRPLRP
jgi:hypothetical protein